MVKLDALRVEGLEIRDNRDSIVDTADSIVGSVGKIAHTIIDSSGRVVCMVRGLG